MAAISPCGNYTVNFVNTQNDKIIPVLNKDSTNFLISNSETQFRVEILALHDDKQEYGVSLFIDGTRIKQYKTFRKKGTFFGVRCNDELCKYRQFQFKLPEMGQRDVYEIASQQTLEFEEDEEVPFNPNLNTIKVQIFKTYKVFTKKSWTLPKVGKSQTNYDPSTIHPNQKFNEQPLSVNLGQKMETKDRLPVVFQNDYSHIDPKTGEKVYYFQKFDYTRDKPLTEINVHYLDYYSATIKKIVMFQQYKNFGKYIPFSYMQDKRVQEKFIFWLVKGYFEKYLKPLTSHLISTKFRKYTQISINDLGYDQQSFFNLLQDSKFLQQKGEEFDYVEGSVPTFIFYPSMESEAQKEDFTDIQRLRRSVPMNVLLQSDAFRKRSSKEKEKIREKNQKLLQATQQNEKQQIIIIMSNYDKFQDNKRQQIANKQQIMEQEPQIMKKQFQNKENISLQSNTPILL